MIITKTNKNLRSVLMEKTGTLVKVPYYLITDKNQVIFVLTPGRNGVEFNKTAGYFSNFPVMQIFQCLYGSGILLMQRNDEVGEVKEFRVVVLNQGKQALVPVGWGMCLVNTGSNFLVVLRGSFLDEKFIDTKPIIEKGGLAYFVIEKKGEIVFEKNENYKLHPQIAME